MATICTVGISDCAVSADPLSILATHALGSCIAVAIYDPLAQVAGLLHFMLPDSSIGHGRAASSPFMYATTGIPLLFRRAYELGAIKQRLRVSLYGGARILDVTNIFDIGRLNYLSACEILRRADVPIHHEEIGGYLPRSLRMQVGSGRILVFNGRTSHEVSDISPQEAELA